MLLRLLRYLLATSLAALPLYGAAAQSAQPAQPAPLLSDYTHSAWGALQGAPVDVLKFAQGRDGWLWIATATGLYRYDGVHFERTDSVYGHPLFLFNVLGLAATGDGALWVGYRLGNVTVFRQDGARTYTQADGLPTGAVFHIEVAPDGAIWVGTRDGAARRAPGANRFAACRAWCACPAASCGCMAPTPSPISMPPAWRTGCTTPQARRHSNASTRSTACRAMPRSCAPCTR